MSVTLYSFRKASSGRIMFLGFIAPSSATAAADLLSHANACPQFGPAHKAGQTIDIEVESDEIPEFEETSLEEFLDLDGDDEEEPEDDEDKEEEEDEDRIEAT